MAQLFSGHPPVKPDAGWRCCTEQFWSWFGMRQAGWWFGTFFIFPYIGNNHPNWLTFFRGVQTTNQQVSSSTSHRSSTCPVSLLTLSCFSHCEKTHAMKSRVATHGLAIDCRYPLFFWFVSTDIRLYQIISNCICITYIYICICINIYIYRLYIYIYIIYIYMYKIIWLYLIISKSS